MTGIRSAFDDIAVFRGRLFLLVAVVGLVIAGLTIPFQLNGRLWSELFNLAHAPVFCGLALLIAGIRDPRWMGCHRSRFIRCLRPLSTVEVLVISVACLLLGTAGELLQPFVGRSFSAGDLLANAAGVGSAALWMVGRMASLGQRRILSAAAAVLLVSVMIRPVAEIRDTILQHRAFPLLASFERAVELSAWSAVASDISRTDAWKTDGQYSLQVEFQSAQFSGVTMIWPVSDWSEYRSLFLDVWNPSDESLRLTLKISDRQHAESNFDPLDRFEAVFEIPAQMPRTLNVDLASVREAPATRDLQLEEVAALELFTVKPLQSQYICVDRIRLE